MMGVINDIKKSVHIYLAYTARTADEGSYEESHGLTQVFPVAIFVIHFIQPSTINNPSLLCFNLENRD